MIFFVELMQHNVNSLIRGITSDLGGMISVTTTRNTVIDTRVEIPTVTFSPDWLGIQKPSRATRVMRRQGKIKL